MGVCLDKEQCFQRRPGAAECPEELQRRGSRRKLSYAEAQFIMQNTGRITDNYVLEKKLGEGSFGTVYKGVHKTGDKEFAIKSVAKDGRLDAVKLREEINIMMSLDHPHVVRLFETVEDKHRIYLVLDLCVGGELFHRIVSCGHFTEPDASEVMTQLLSAVVYLHEMNICHRDLKPENFLLETKEALSQNCLKIIDFGLSCSAKENETMSEKVGSPSYVSPQILQGRYTRACDLWSCGVILYILLCGMPPFHGESPKEIFASIRRSVVSMKGNCWKTISGDAKDLVKGLLRRPEKKRLTALEAMDHVWIKQRAPQASQTDLPSRTFLNLKNFHSQNKLKRAALRIIAGHLSNEQILQLRKAFSLMDSDRSGMLTVDELKEGLQCAGVGHGQELEEIVQSMDTDGNGEVSYTEFLAAAIDRSKSLTKAVCRTAFEIFDLNGDGVITEAELRTMLEDNSVQDSLGRQKVRQILQEVDKDGDGQIDFNEFMLMMGTGNEISLDEQADTAEGESSTDDTSSSEE